MDTAEDVCGTNGANERKKKRVKKFFSERAGFLRFGKVSDATCGSHSESGNSNTA